METRLLDRGGGDRTESDTCTLLWIPRQGGEGGLQRRWNHNEGRQQYLYLDAQGLQVYQFDRKLISIYMNTNSNCKFWIFYVVSTHLEEDDGAIS